MQPTTQYAKSGDVHIAYQLFGSGPINLIMVPGFVSNVENYWDEPDLANAPNRMMDVTQSENASHQICQAMPLAHH